MRVPNDTDVWYYLKAMAPHIAPSSSGDAPRWASIRPFFYFKFPEEDYDLERNTSGVLISDLLGPNDGPHTDPLWLEVG